MYLIDINNCIPRAIITVTTTESDAAVVGDKVCRVLIVITDVTFFSLSVFAAKRQQNKP